MQTSESVPEQWTLMAIVCDKAMTFMAVLFQGSCIYSINSSGKKTISNGFFDISLHSNHPFKLEPTRSEDTMGCKGPKDIVKVSVKEEPMHTGLFNKK